MSDAAPTVSIAIRAYRRRWLAEAMSSVLEQTWRDLELVVYDDAGDLHPVVAGFDDPRVRYVRAERKLGASGRYKAALAHTRGRYVGVLDDDDRYEAGFLSRLVGALEEHPEAGVAFCRVRWLADGSLYPEEDRLAPGPQPSLVGDLLRGRIAIQPSRMLVRRAALEDAEQVQAMPDGVAPDLFVNVLTTVAGWRHVLVGEQLVTCRWHEDQHTRTGRNGDDIGVASRAFLRLPDPELDKVRRSQHAARLVERSFYSLREGDAASARADVRAAAEVDPDVAVRRRRLATAVAATPFGARAFAAARGVKRRFHRRDALPPRVRLDATAAGGRPERRVARDAAALAVGNGAAQAVTILVAPILTRLFDPAAVGAAGVLTGAMLLVAPVACLRLDISISLARSARDAGGLCASCLIAGAGVSALLGVLAVLFGPALCEAANVPQMTAYVWLVPVHAALVVPGLVGVGLLTRQRRFGALAGSRFAQTAGQASTQVAAGAVTSGAAAWFAGGVTAGAAAWSITAVTRARRAVGHFGGRVGEAFRSARGAAREWRRFALWSSGGALLLAASGAVPPILVAGFYGPAAAGLFLLAQRVIGLPVTFASDAVSAAWFGTAAQIVREERGGLRAPLRAITRTMLLVGGAALVMVVAAGPPLFEPVFGSAWGDAGELVLVLAPLYFSIFAAAPAGMTLQALGRSDLLTAVSAARLAAPVAGIAGGHALGWSLTASVGLYAAAMAAISVVNATLAWRLSGDA